MPATGIDRTARFENELPALNDAGSILLVRYVALRTAYKRHSAGTPLKLVSTAVSEFQAGSCDQVPHRTRHEDLARRGCCHHSGTNVYRNPAQLAARHLAFTGVNTGPDPKPEPGSPSTIADAQRIALAGPSKCARKPSPALSTSRPRWRTSSRRISELCDSISARQRLSPNPGARGTTGAPEAESSSTSK